MKILYIFLIVLTTSCATPLSVQVDSIKNKSILDSTDDRNSLISDYSQHKKIKSIEEDLLDEKTSTDTLEVKRLVNLAQIYVLKKEYDRARECVSGILKLDLKNKDAKLISATIYYRENRLDMVTLILNSLGGEASSESAALNLLALVAMEKKEYAKAMQLFQTSIRLNPSETSPRMNLGILYLKYRQLKEAAIQFERVLKVVPNYADAMLHLAIVDIHRGKFLEAEKAFQELLDTKNGSKNPLVSLNYGFLLLKQKKLEDALSRFNDYVDKTSSRDLDPNRERVQTLIADIEKTLQSQKIKLDDQAIEKMAVNFEQSTSKATEKASTQDSSLRVGETLDHPAEAVSSQENSPQQSPPARKSSSEVESLEKELLE